MKRLHRSDLFAWSVFDESRNVDFNGTCWVRPSGGNVLIDPMPMSMHDRQHLSQLGGCATIVVTNSDHTREAAKLAEAFGATLIGPAAERDSFPIECDEWVDDGDEVVEGLMAYALEGSKTPGELALVLERTTLITGDLIRAHVAGELMILPSDKLTDRDKAIASIHRLVERNPALSHVVVGDGWAVVRNGGEALEELLYRLRG